MDHGDHSGHGGHDMPSNDTPMAKCSVRALAKSSTTVTTS